ncbi:ABC transporter ATP-binding protein [Clostridiaceae bacterium M8S5]|nr:ABC transporter ATP-binding protein [Clostridiaceae bacterium M8S5]
MYKIRDINKSYGELIVLENLNIDINKNIITCIIGPSGCGKTTLFNIIAGMLNADSGKLGDIENETISYLFQESRLLKWKTVKENIEFVLKDKMDLKEIREVTDKYLKLVGLKEYKDYYPNKLSGGMKQRVSIARAFAYPADLLLMDEPFKSLDYELKTNLIYDFRRIQRVDNKTVIFITHDINAASILGDEIIVLTDKPTKIKKVVTNTIPKESRSLENAELLDFQRGLIQVIKNK